MLDRRQHDSPPPGENLRIGNWATKTILVLDGHDGSGKTTLAARLAATCKAAHLRPFAGPLGEGFSRAVAAGEFATADRLAREATARAIQSAETPLVIVDRHWLTAFSVLPEAYWPGWQPLPPTTLCWADLKTTVARLRARRLREPCYPHDHFLSVYWHLGQRFGCHLLRTDLLREEQALERLIRWTRSVTTCGR